MNGGSVCLIGSAPDTPSHPQEVPMSRTAARFTQADIARATRAAIQAGAKGIEIRPDGVMFLHLAKAEHRAQDGAPPTAVDDDEIIVL
jgi:hypothetical protein